MIKNNIPQIAISGSIAYDKIMDFPGVFSSNVVKGKKSQVHELNLSLIVDNLKTSFGGTAGNIAYNLSLLKEKPIIFGIVGFDILDYRQHLLKQKLNLSYLKELKNSPTATAHIITDKNDNQISAFYPCPAPKNYATKAVAAACKNNNLVIAIIAPDNKDLMLEYAAAYRARKIPFIFDPGQAIQAFSAKDLSSAIQGAYILIGNDYEINYISQSLGLSIKDLSAKVKILVITKGDRGSEIYQAGKKIIVSAAKPKNTSDPTGAGDAYRAGLIKGLIKGYNLKTCGQLASTVAVYTVEKYGTQTHQFTIKNLQERYNNNFKENIAI
jgi:adenosine kinase